MKINENLLRYKVKETRTGATESSIFYISYVTPTQDIKNSVVSVSADIELINNHPNGEISIVFQIERINGTKSYKVETIKYVNGQRSKWQNMNFSMYSDIKNIGVGFYIGGVSRTMGVTGTIQNIKLEIGTEATLWIPHRDDLTSEQSNLMPEHLFGGGYRLEGDSSDLIDRR